MTPIEQRSMNKLTEQKQSSVLKHVLKIIYAPHKAFKEITQNPKLIGPILVMALVIVASLGAEYTKDMKIYVQQTIPAVDVQNADSWTETMDKWASNANITTNTADSLLGANSIQFDASNGTLIWAELKDIGTIDCSSGENYGNLTFGMKWINNFSTAPKDINLFLFSRNSTEYFLYNLTEYKNQTINDQWGNYTIPLGSSTVQWIKGSSQAMWDNITGLRIEATWDDSARSNLTIRVDAMYFLSDHFEQQSNKIVENSSLYALGYLMDYGLYWILTSVSLLVAARMFKAKAELKTFLTIAGYSRIAFFFIPVLLSIFYIANPPLYYSLDPNSSLYWINNLTLTGPWQYWFALNFYATLLLPIWAIILSAFGVRAAFGLTARNSIILAVIGYIAYYVVLFSPYLR